MAGIAERPSIMSQQTMSQAKMYVLQSKVVKMQEVKAKEEAKKRESAELEANKGKIKLPFDTLKGNFNAQQTAQKRAEILPSVTRTASILT